MIANLANAALALSQSLELSLIVKATAVVLLALVGARLASHERASVRHLLLASAFVALLALPLVALTGPRVTIDVPVAQPAAIASSAPAPVAAPSAPPAPAPAATITGGWKIPDRGTMMRAIWIGGVIVCLTPLVLTIWRLRRIRRTGIPFAPMLSVEIERHVARRVEFLQHEDVAAPLTFGVLRPVIVVPYDADDWSGSDLQRALIHELEHVRRRDWAIHVLGRIVCAVYWFHPLVWLAGRQLSLEAERACDDAVVASSESTDYAEQLVVLAQRLSAADTRPLLGMANRSDLSARVTALLDSTQQRGRASLAMATATIATTGAIVLGMAPLTAVARVERSDINISATANSEEQRRGNRLDRALDRELYEAAESGDIDGINEMLQAGANVNAAIQGDGSPLIAAARRGRIDVAQLLLDRGANPDMGVDGDGSPLIAAAERGALDMVTLLLDRGANPNVGVEGDGSPLIAAAGAGHVEIMELLIVRGADVELVVNGDENPLIKACEAGQLAAVRALVSRGANVNARVWADFYRGGTTSGEWRTPLSMARRGDHKEIVALLISAGARE